MGSYEREMEVGLRAVRAAARLCESARLQGVESRLKEDRSPVTVADLGGQAVVALLLQEAFPGDPLTGEEEAEELADPALLERVMELVAAILGPIPAEQVVDGINRGRHAGGRAGRFWTLDPIDGTKGFLRNDQYAVALALIEDGEVRLGLLACPLLALDGSPGTLFGAVARRGAWQAPLDGGERRPIRVRPAGGGALRFCESVESGHTAQGRSARVAEALGAGTPLRLDSQAKYGCVARGDAQAYLRLPTRADYREKIWDHAAGDLVVREAGGRVSDIDGRPLDYSLGRTLAANRGVVACTPDLQERLLDAIRAAE